MISLAKLANLPAPPRAPQPDPSKAALYWLFGSTLFVLIPHLTRQPLWLGSLSILLIFWRLFSLQRNIKTPGWLVNGSIAIVLVALVLFQYQTIFGRTAGSAMLVIFAAMKTMETTTLRDAMFSAVLLMVLVMTNFLFDQSPSAALYGLAGMLLIVGNLNMLVAPKALDIKQVIRFTLRMLMHGIPLALAAYLLFPRIEGSLWGLAEDPFSGVTGLSDTVSPGSLSNLSRNNDVAFRVEFSGVAPNPEDLYWRTLVLDVTNGKTWQQGPKPMNHGAPRPQTGGDLQIYDITLEASGQPWIPVLETAYEVDTSSGINANGIVIARRPVKQRLRYQGVSFLNGKMAAPRPEDFNSQLYHGIKPRVLEFAQQLTEQHHGPIEIADAVLNFFNQQEFYYSLTPPLLGDNPVDEFLFDSRSGYCEHYASAFSSLMRAAGIPARVVVGYQGSEASNDGTYHIVRQSNAHAWSEIWIDGHGWVRVDPTAAVAPERIQLGMNPWIEGRRSNHDSSDYRSGERSATLREMFSLDFLTFMISRLELGADSFTHRWNQWVLSYGPEQQRDLLKQFGFKAPDWGFMLISLFFISMIFILATYYVLSRPGKLAESPLKYFRQFKHKLAKSGVILSGWEGPVNVADEGVRRLPEQASQIREISNLYTTLEYGEKIDSSLFERLKTSVRNFSADKIKTPDA